MTIFRNCLALNPATLGPRFARFATGEFQDIGEAEVKRWGRLHRYCDFVVRTVVEVEGGDLFMVSTKDQDEAVAKAMRSAARKRKYQPMGGEARSRSNFIQWEAA